MRPLQGPHCGVHPEVGGTWLCVQHEGDGANACTCADESIWRQFFPYRRALQRWALACRSASGRWHRIVAVPQLFPTPPELADRMVALADIRPGQQVLEPSAGTGRIIDAIRRNAHGYAITAVELNCNMAHRLRTVDCVDDTRQADFLECNGDLGTFDRIVMNPPLWLRVGLRASTSPRRA